MTKLSVMKLRQECDSLWEKVTKLGSFLNTSAFYRLSPANKNLLTWQHEVMKQYAEILECRIELNKENKQ